MYNENNIYENNVGAGTNDIYEAETIIDSTVTNEQILPPDKKPKKSGTGKKAMKLVAAALVFGLVAGGVFQGVNFAIDKVNEKKDVTVSSGEQPGTITPEEKDTNRISSVSTSGLSNVPSSVSEVVENVMPSIVAINCTALNSQNDVFGRQFQQETQGSGSGIIIGQNNNEVLIVTNNHVIAGTNPLVQVVFADDSTANATIKGTESSSDLAVISVQLSELSNETKSKIAVASLGDSDTVKVGEMAIAIGNALGYGQSVTVGYVSATERQVALEDATMNLLQTDAAINPGNSGGALLNANGEVIGINSVKYASTEVEGIGYAIPISQAVPIINELMSREILSDSEQAYLGIMGQDVTEGYAQRFNMPIGIYVGPVTEGSPAEQAGLKEGNIIVTFNGKEISTMNELGDILSYTKAGEKAVIGIKVLKNGQYQDEEINVELGSKPLTN